MAKYEEFKKAEERGYKDGRSQRSHDKNNIPVLGEIVDFIAGQTEYNPPKDPDLKKAYDAAYKKGKNK